MAGYSASIVGVLALCLLSLLLALYSGRSKGAAGALSGPVLDARDDNRLYRIDRVHMNSVEALTPFVASAIIAMLVGMAPVFLAIRLVHLVVYLRGGEPAKGGHLRTVLYVSSALVTLVLILAAGWSALA